MVIKEFTNQELKKLINNLYFDNNIKIHDELQKIIDKSSRVHYDTLYKHYTDIKNLITERLINQSDNSNDYEIIDNKDIILQTKEIETQTEISDVVNPIIEIQDNINPIKSINDLKIENFKLNQELNDYKFKYKNIKKEFKQFRKLKEIKNINYNSSSDEDNYIKEKKIDYHEIPNLSSFNLIQELKKLNRHQLKQLYNKYFSQKHQRQLNN